MTEDVLSVRDSASAAQDLVVQRRPAGDQIPAHMLYGPDGNPISSSNPLAAQIVGSSLSEPPTVGEVTLDAAGTVTELKAGASRLSGRYRMIVYPPSAGTIYWGPTDVTSADGAPLTSTDDPVVFTFDAATAVPIYAVSDGTLRAVRVVEAK